MKSYIIVGFILGITTAALAQPPAVTGFTPVSGITGSQITINGANFKPTPSDNHVFFGTAKADISSATTDKLVVKVPSGATNAALSVTVNGLTAWSSQPFHVTFPTNKFIDVNSFAAYTDLNTDAEPQDVAFGDFDNDGKTDIAVVNSTANTVQIYRNESNVGTPKFTNVVSLATAATPIKVALQDFDGDGRLDIAALGGTAISVLRNTHSGGPFSTSSFATHVDFASGTTHTNPLLSVADIDLDGRADMITANSSSSVLVWQNLAVPGIIDITSFKMNATLTVFDDPTGLAVADVDADGKQEVLAAVRSGNRISVFKNVSSPGPLNGSSFLAAIDFTLNQVTTLTAGDLDGDGKPDLAAERHDDGHVFVFRNLSDPGSITPGSFDTPVDLGAPGTPADILMSDVDGDGGTDLVVSSQFGPLTVYHNTNNGTINATTFEIGVNFESADYMYGIEMGDLDGDGRPDVAAAKNFNVALLSIALNNVSFSPPPPTVAGFSPASGPIGTTVTITGTSFSPNTTDNIVYFGATAATVTAASDTELMVTVPLGATYQPISVTVSGFTITTDKPFTVTFPNGTINGTAFGTKVDFFLNNTADRTTLGDLDGDGKSDLATLNGGLLSVFINTSTTGVISPTSFETRFDFPTGYSNPSSIVIGDVDGDGKKDIITTDFNPSVLSIFRNLSSGTFDPTTLAPQVDLQPGGNARDVVLKDLDGDGKLDFILADGSTVVVIRNRTSPGNILPSLFETKVNLPGAVPVAVAAQDLDGDNKPEIIAVGNQVSVYKNNSSLGSLALSSFAAPVTFPGTATARGIAVGDLDDDDKPDLAVTQNTADVVSVYRNETTAGVINTTSFAARVDFTTGDGPSGVAIADLDGEGKADIIVSNDGPRNVSVFENSATPGAIDASSFAAKVDYTTGIIPGVTVGDLDGDHKPEIVVSNFASSIGVLQNLVAPLPLIIATSSNESACDSEIAELNVNATGTTNLAYQWQKFNGSVYVDVVDGGPYAGATLATLTVTTTGNTGAGDYRCRVSGDLALTAYANATLAVNPVPLPVAISVTGSTTICDGATTTLNAPVGHTGYLWSNGETTASITVSMSDDYTVQVSNGAGCLSAPSPTVTIIAGTTPPQPVITVNGSAAICPATGVVLSAPTGFQSYIWSTGEISRDILATAAGDYTVTVTNSAGCVSAVSAITTITIGTDCSGPIDPTNRAPVVFPVRFSAPVGSTESYSLLPHLSDPDGNLDLSSLKIVAAFAGAGSPSIEAGTTTLVVDYTGVGFIGEDHISIQVCDDNLVCTQAEVIVDVVGEIIVHNGITPDGDGFNDLLIVEYVDVVPGANENKLTILNRWGDMVFETENYDNISNPFIGLTTNGSELPSGTYFYKFEINAGKTYTGYVTLRR